MAESSTRTLSFIELLRAKFTILKLRFQTMTGFVLFFDLKRIFLFFLQQQRKHTATIELQLCIQR